MDVDIDTQTSFDPKELFPEVVRASMIQNGEIKKHPAGVYFQDMPSDPVSELAAIPYKEAENNGFYKIDFLHLGLLNEFESKKEIRALLRMDPDWSILEDPSNYEGLFQISRHYNSVGQIKPRSVEELADCIALIRPGKRQLLQTYIDASREYRRKIRTALYAKPENGEYYFKKSHAHAYALTVVLQLHLIGDK